MSDATLLAPDRADPAAAFAALQDRLRPLFETVFPDPAEPRTVVVVPSLTLDAEVLDRITGVHHYEERLLCLLLLLRMPRTKVIYLSSEPIAEAVVDYFLHLLPGVPHRHARARLSMLACHDSSRRALTEKVLDRPRLIRRIEEALGPRDRAHMVCFNVTERERDLALALDIPIYGCDPVHLPFGSKSGGRRMFRGAGVPIPDGEEDLSGPADVARALAALRGRDPALRRAVVKLNEGFSGEGNALFRFDAGPEDADAIAGRLPDLGFEAAGMTWPLFAEKLAEMGGIVEAFVEGAEKRSPSVQYRVDPAGALSAISTHDQVLGGAEGGVFLGCTFPADPAYRLAIQEAGRPAAEALRDAGVLGRFGIDFISVKAGDGWRHYAIEVNLRKGGTTHPFLMLQMLTDGAYEEKSGLFRTRGGEARYYRATDNLEAPEYRGLSPDDLIDIALRHDLHFHSGAGRGVVFHLIGALSEYGKLGAVAVGESPEAAAELYATAVAALDLECGRNGG